MQPSLRGLNILQKISMSLMGVLVLITFVGANIHAVLWQSSDWLVSTVLPAVVVQLTNDERLENAAPPLQRNATLDAAAKLKAEHMAKNEYFAHFSPGGVSPWHWFDEAGYTYAYAGENLAIHFTDSTEVVEAWMNSPLHRQNIVNGLYTEIGVGTAKGEFEGYETVYVVQLFGTPAIAPAPVITTPIPPEVTVVEEESTVLSGAVESVTVAASQTTPHLVATQEQSDEKLVEEVVLPADAAIVVSEPIDGSQAGSEFPVVLESESSVVNEPDEIVTSVTNDVVVIESPIISTSSGLAVANITTPNHTHAGATVASIATQPNELLQITYLVLGVIVFILLLISIAVEARRLHFVQVAYGVMLLVGMGSLWFVHALLTSGAVVV